MQVLDKQASSNKIWFYQHFGGGGGQTMAQAQSDLDTERLSGIVAKSLRADRKKTPDQRYTDLTKLVAAGLAVAQRATANGKLDNAITLFDDANKVLNSPMLRPKPDDRLDKDMTQQERDERDRERMDKTVERRRLLALQRQQIANTLALAVNPSPQFNQLTAQLAKIDEDIKLAGVEQADPFRAALFDTSVRTAMATLGPKIARDVPPAHQDRVTTKLGSKITEILDQMVSEAVLKYMEANNATQTGQRDGRAYSVVMSELLANGGQALHQQFPGLQERIDLETQQFQATIGELFDRVHADQADLEQNMFGGQAMTGLKNITVADSDPHNGGHRVTILTFEGTDGNEYRVVNKPRDIRVDAKFVGATGQGGMNASLSERATELMRTAEAKRLEKEENIGLLVDLLHGQIMKANGAAPPRAMLEQEIATKSANQLADMVEASEKGRTRILKGLIDTPPNPPDPRHLVTAAQNVKELPTYKFIDKQDAGNHRYGWVEFIEHNRPGDCILDRPKAKNFYQQTGQLAGLAFLCGIEDIHQGNMMIRDGQPVLTDLEIAFSGKNDPDPGFDPATASDNDVKKYVRNKLATTMISKALGQGTQVSHNGNALVANDRIAKRPSETGTEATENTVFLEDPVGTLTSQTEGMPNQFAADFRAGFAQICDAFGDPDLEDDNDDFIDGFAGMDVRYHALATAAQLSTRRTEMEKGYPDSINTVSNNLLASMPGPGGNMAAKVQSDPWIADLIPSMANDLANRDVAYYTQTLGSRQVKHNGTTPIVHNGGSNVLAHDGLAVARRNMQLMILRGNLVKEEGDKLLGNLNNEGQWAEINEFKQKMLTARGGGGGG